MDLDHIGDIPVKSYLDDMTWDPTDLVVDVEDKVKDVHNVGQEDKTGFLNKSYMYQLEVNLTVKSDLFSCKQNPSVDVVANFIDVMWKQEDQKKCLPTFCNLKVSKFEMGLNEGFCNVETYQIIQRVGCGQNKKEKKVMDWNKKDPDKMNKIKTSILNKTKYGMSLVLLLSAFCSVSSATKIDGDCLQTSVSGFVGNGEDLVLHCKCNCSCAHSWRWSGGPNNVDLTNNQQVLSSNIEKINITENPPGVHEYSMTLKTKDSTDFFSSDFTCHNGFATKKINRSELLQHISLQSTVTSTMSSPEQTKSSTMLTHQQTRTTTMSTLKPTMASYNSKLNDGTIAAIVIGSVLGVVVVGVAVFLVRRKCNSPKKENTEAAISMNSSP